MSEEPRKDAIRNAATIVLVRQDSGAPKVLMGQRGKSAAFMPNKFVFPGGAVDAQDALVTAQIPMSEHVRSKLAERSEPKLADTLPMTAIRELWEETGQALAVTEGDAP
ncbi:MAG: NUDIX hydrolase, partial [Pseudomonadota bacterium]